MNLNKTFFIWLWIANLILANALIYQAIFYPIYPH